MHAAHKTPEMPAFMQTQYAFAGAVRDPDKLAAPDDVPAKRMAVYRELIYNNIDEFLSNAFPVLRRISSDERWNGLMRDFLVEHRAKTPLFPEMPREFVHYLEAVRTPRDDDFPFMLELAHYEWAELALSISEEQIDESAVDRDRDDRVGFMALNPVTALLLSQLQENSEKCGETILREMAAAMQHPNPETVLKGGEAILQELLERDVILGCRKGLNSPPPTSLCY